MTSARRARITSSTPSGCRCGSVRPRDGRRRRAACPHRRSAPSASRRLRGYIEAFGDESTEPADPDPRMVLVEGVGLHRRGHRPTSPLARGPYHRAIAVIAGAAAAGPFVSLDDAETSPSSTGRSSSTSSRWRRRRASSPGRESLVTAAPVGIGTTVVASPPPARSSSGRPRPRGAEGRSRVGEGGWRSQKRHERGGRGRRVRRRGRRFDGVDVVMSSAGSASSAAIEDTSWADGTSTTTSS